MIIKDEQKLQIVGKKSEIMYDLTKILESLKDNITKEEILLCLNLAYAEDQKKFMKDTIKQKLNELFENSIKKELSEED